MLKLIIDREIRQPLRILCFGAHSDDIEIGCGGSIIRFLEEFEVEHVDWIILSSNDQRAEEARLSALRFLTAAKSKTIIIKGFQDSFFPYIGGEIKGFFEDLKSEINPNLIFTPYRHDLHQDHRLVSELTWNTWRNHLILEYEVIKYDGDLGSPNFFIHLNNKTSHKKTDIILESFKTQVSRDWFTRDSFLSIMRIRGIESRAPGKYAEGFYCRKLIL
jgi:LmbE family N-acetylglucosaminyl deacetylase